MIYHHFKISSSKKKKLFPTLKSELLLSRQILTMLEGGLCGTKKIRIRRMSSTSRTIITADWLQTRDLESDKPAWNPSFTLG